MNGTKPANAPIGCYCVDIYHLRTTGTSLTDATDAVCLYHASISASLRFLFLYGPNPARWALLASLEAAVPVALVPGSMIKRRPQERFDRLRIHSRTRFHSWKIQPFQARAACQRNVQIPGMPSSCTVDKSWSRPFEWKEQLWCSGSHGNV